MIFIHRSPVWEHSTCWSLEWEKLCVKLGLEHEVRDFYNTLALRNLNEGDILLWHIQHFSPTDMTFARSILEIARGIGVKTFPSYEESWHFDDKVAQLLLLKAHSFDIPDHVFFIDKHAAKSWLKTAKFPVIAKLKSGSGSNNVKLIGSEKRGNEYIEQMFGAGVTSGQKLVWKSASNLRSVSSLSDLFRKLKRLPDFLASYRSSKHLPRERDYVSFQEFIPNNGFDLKVYIVGDKSLIVRRPNRKNDFRASGGGAVIFDKSLLNSKVIYAAREISRRFGFFCMGYDFVINNRTGHPVLIEMSFGFDFKTALNCKGYWNQDLDWIDDPLNVPHEILKDLIKR